MDSNHIQHTNASVVASEVTGQTPLFVQTATEPATILPQLQSQQKTKNIPGKSLNTAVNYLEKDKYNANCVNFVSWYKI